MKFRIILLVVVTMKGLFVVKFSFPKIASVVSHFKGKIILIYSAFITILIAVKIYLLPCKWHFLLVPVLWFRNCFSGQID